MQVVGVPALDPGGLSDSGGCVFCVAAKDHLSDKRWRAGWIVANRPETCVVAVVKIVITL